MRYILTLLLLIGVAQAQFAPTGAKTNFKNGIALGTRDTTGYTSADSLVVTIDRAGRMWYRSTDGYFKQLATGGSLTSYKLIADTFFTNGYTTRGRTRQQIDSLAAAANGNFIRNQFTGAQTADAWISGRIRSASIRVLRPEQDSAVAVFSNNSFDPFSATFDGWRFQNAGAGATFRTQLEGFSQGVNGITIRPGTAGGGNGSIDIGSYYGTRQTTASSVWGAGYSNGSRIFSDASNRLSWLQAGPSSASFDISALAANRVYTLPNVDGNVILSTSANFTSTISSTNSSGNIFQSQSGNGMSFSNTGFSFNRNVSTGAIYNSAGFAYQWQKTNSTTNTNDFLRLQVYTTAGGLVTDQAISFNGAGNVAFPFAPVFFGTNTNNGSGAVAQFNGNINPTTDNTRSLGTAAFRWSDTRTVLATISGTTASTSPTTGALIVTGGAGFGQAINAEGIITSGTAATSGNVIANGPTSGTGAGSSLSSLNGGVVVARIGNRSALIGGTYSNTPTFGFNGSLGFRDLSGAGADRGGFDASGVFFVNGSASLGQTFTNSQFVSTTATTSGIALSGYRITSTPAQSTSRQWLLTSDLTTYGDFQIMQSTTATGSTFQNALRFDSTRNAYFAARLSSIGLTQPISAERTANYTLTASDHTVVFDCSGGNRTATLPAGVEGTIYVIKRKNETSANKVTIVPNGTETIDGQSAWDLVNCGHESVTIQFRGGTWYIIASHYEPCL